MGFGLFILCELVKLFGGDIEFVSEEGEGSEFIVMFLIMKSDIWIVEREMLVEEIFVLKEFEELSYCFMLIL